MEQIDNKKFWGCLILGMIFPFVASLVYFVFLKDSSWGQTAYLGAKAGMLGWPLLCVYGFFRERVPFWKCFHPLTGKKALWGIGLGSIIVLLMFLWMHSPLAKFVEEGAPAVRAKVVQLGFIDHFIVFALFLSLLHSFLEEYYWRWFVYGQLRKVLPLWGAHLLSACCFALHHFVVVFQFFGMGFAAFLAVAVAVGGVLWSLCYEKLGTLFPSWISHVLVDLALMKIGYDLVFS